jgi:hypothetical protein
MDVQTINYQQITTQKSMKKTKLCIFCSLIFITCFYGCKKALLDTGTVSPMKEKAVARATSTADLALRIGQKVQEFREKRPSYEEKYRMGINYWQWTDFEPTGFFLPPDSSLTITVDQTAGNQLPKLLIGTYYLRKETQSSVSIPPREVQLTSGVNTIPSDSKGGIIWVRFDNTAEANSRATITFDNGYQKMPVYVKNQTNQSWHEQLTTYSTSPDVLLIGDRVYQVYSRDLALEYYSQYSASYGDAYNSYTLEMADYIWDQENYLLGLDSSAPEHMPSDHNRCLMAQETMTWSGGYAYVYGTAYYPGYWRNAFTMKMYDANQTYVVAHEMGHLHQQSAYNWSTLSNEVTNEIFSVYIDKLVSGGKPSMVARAGIWPGVKNYLDNTSPDKNFNTSFANSFTSNVNWLRLSMFLQLQMAYGDEFIVQLHKKGRYEISGLDEDSPDEDKMRYFMLQSCIISGKNLSNFFRKWGFKVNEEVYTAIAALNLPDPVIDPTTLTETPSGALSIAKQNVWTLPLHCAPSTLNLKNGYSLKLRRD